MLSDTTQELSITLEDAQTTTESNEMPVVVPQGIKAKIFPPERLSLDSFINFPLPSYASAGSNGDLTQYFVTLPPDLTTMTAIMDVLQTLPLPPPSVIKQLSSQAASAWQNGSRSLVYAHANDPCRFAFWVLSFWRGVSELRTNQMGWRAAQRFLSQPAFHHDDSEAIAFTAHMSTLPWSDRIMVRGFGDWVLVQDLRQFASRDWLNNSHLNVMLGVMYDKIKAIDPAVELRYKVQNTFFCAQLCAAYAARATYAESRSVVRDAGIDAPHTICFISHVRGNHWTGIAIDSVNLHIYYSDSLQAPIPDDLKTGLVDSWIRAKSECREMAHVTG
ncbi:hypothetical protein L210DRAFT_3502462 [Boletus edulis BED1]|uniref:Ubiquitin-like protease family profile domain-containing protein n=1 Tax=Boletus edulis BED1 TaxID=1328754 RepID=A0AAD4BZE5_BOLED|nr:hypothetical protein L210DRAFT_3502462 [Boletus edulis BED1]